MKSTECKIVETFVLDEKAITKTQDGYLTAMPRIARTGIQIYRGAELGVPTMDEVRVWRPEEEVFAVDSLKSFAFRPITDDHPKESVNAKNWKQYTAGQSGGEVVRDGEYIRIPMTLMDAAVIDKIDAGKVQLSVGYSANLKWGDGVTSTGEKYNAIQTNIRANHIAVVKTARGGPELAIGDQIPDHQVTIHVKQETAPMTTNTNKTIVVDGISVEMSEIAASVVNRAMAVLNDAATTAKTALATAETKIAQLTTDGVAAADTAKKAIEAKDAEIVTLKKQLADSEITPAKLDQLVNDRHIVIAKARATIGDALVVDGKTLSDIQGQVVLAKVGDAAKAWTPEQINASFATLTAGVDITKVADATSALANGIAAVHQSGGANVQQEQRYDNYNKKLSDAWKTPNAA